ncbi:MAG: RNA polymerase sporulation sigma factor SigH [Bacillota bacterium]|nr:MAG: RNA polymerase sporulation sigma factor SigH [Bacillota bacterium]
MDAAIVADEELCARAQGGDLGALNALFDRYRTMVKSIVHSYFLSGGDREDLLQEGMIGLFKAVNGYNGKAGFKTFAALCVKRNVLSAIRLSGRDKHKPLNNYVSLSGAGEDGAGYELLVGREVLDPETEYINNESLAELTEGIHFTLSKFERKVLALYLDGYSYENIGEKLGKSAKSADNALQRIRKKIERIVNKEGA